MIVLIYKGISIILCLYKLDLLWPSERQVTAIFPQASGTLANAVLRSALLVFGILTSL